MPGQSFAAALNSREVVSIVSIAHYLAKRKKAFSDGEIVKEVMTVVADTLFKDHKSGKEIMAAIGDVH